VKRTERREDEEREGRKKRGKSQGREKNTKQERAKQIKISAEWETKLKNLLSKFLSFYGKEWVSYEFSECTGHLTSDF
jgi:hypothetical protein